MDQLHHLTGVDVAVSAGDTHAQAYCTDEFCAVQFPVHVSPRFSTAHGAAFEDAAQHEISTAS